MLRKKIGLLGRLAEFCSRASSLRLRKTTFGLGLLGITTIFLASGTFGSYSRMDAPTTPPSLTSAVLTHEVLPAKCKKPPEKLLGAELLDAMNIEIDDTMVLAYTISNESMELTTRFVVEMACDGTLTMLVATSFPLGLDTEKIPGRY